MALSNAIYNSLFRRNSVYVTGIVVTAFGMGIGLDLGLNAFWDRWNRGKQWKDIRAQYIQAEDE